MTNTNNKNTINENENNENENNENENNENNENNIEEKSKMLTETLKFITDYKNNLLKQYPHKLEISESNLPPQAF
jgi:hypothetical protein